MDKLLIDVGQQGNGCVFVLSPRTRANFKEELAGAKKFSRVFVGYDRQAEPTELVGTMSQQIITLLTGLPQSAIEKLGGFAFRNPVTGEEIFRKRVQDG